MNQGKLKVVKQEMARVNIDILGISKLKWTGMGEFNSDDHYIYNCGQGYFRRNGIAITVNKRVWKAVLRCNIKNDQMISVHFQGKPFNSTVIQVYAQTNNAEEVEVEQFFEDLQDLLESESPSVVSSSVWPHGLYSPCNSPGQNTVVSRLSFSRGSSQPRGQTRISCIAGRFFTSWAYN